MLGRALVPRKDATPATRASTAIASIGGPSVPVQLTNGIRDLMISFANQSQGDADARRLLEIYVKATTHVHEAVAIEAVKTLLFDNPRNPYRPSPQDVYERSSKTDRKWFNLARDYFLAGLKAEVLAKWGSAPLTDGCRVPDDLVKKYLAQYLERERHIDEELGRLSRDWLAKIPDECFADGQKARALAEVDRRERMQAEREAKEKYLEFLDPILRQEREEVLRRNSRGAFAPCLRMRSSS